MKKNFKEPELKVINILSMDVIATSNSQAKASTNTATIIVEDASGKWTPSTNSTTMND